MLLFVAGKFPPELGRELQGNGVGLQGMGVAVGLELARGVMRIPQGLGRD